MERLSAQSRLIQFSFLGALGLAWWYATAFGHVHRLLLPAPAEVWKTFVTIVQTPPFWRAVGVTFSSIVQAYFLAALSGIIAGYLFTRSKTLTGVMEPILSGLFTVPLTLLLPVFVLFFGIGPASKIAYGAVYAFFPVALNTIAAFANVDERWLRAARSMGASRWDTFRHILIPNAFPVVVTGLRIGFVICFASVLGGETIASAVGIGHNISLSAEQMDPGKLYAWISFVTATAIALNLLLSAIENRVVKRERR